MRNTEKRSGAKVLRERLKNPEIIRAPGCYDCLSARLVEQAGFEAAFMTGFGASGSILGQPDYGLMTMNEMAAVCANMNSVLNIPLLAPRPDRDLTGVLIADIVLQLLSYVAQTEREFNRQRQAGGIAAAKAKGVHFGRKFKDRGENYEDVMAAWKRGEISGRAAAKKLGVAHGTFQRWCKE